VRAPLAGARARIVPVSVDADGFDVGAAEGTRTAARAAFVSPSHQYPLGVTMSVSRRLALLSWAARTGGWIVEDDYDSEFRYASRPLPCVQGLDTADRVIYVGTFSKTVFPALRLGFLIVPPSLVDRFAAARASTDRHSPTIEQAVLAAFLADGHYARHVRRMRALYAERQDALVDAGRGVLADAFEIAASGAGMHLVAWLRSRRDDAALSRAALALGIETQPISRFALRPYPRAGLMLGYAAYTPAEIRSAAAALARAARG
jgi:GntR family transcriptional regulator/MocR family aminotransferase